MSLGHGTLRLREEENSPRVPEQRGEIETRRSGLHPSTDSAPSLAMSPKCSRQEMGPKVIVHWIFRKVPERAAAS